MHLEVIRSLEQFDHMKDEWNKLLQDGASHVPFLRHEYLTAWWHSLGGGEWSQCELYIATTRRDDGELAAIAPLFLTNNREGEPALLIMGSYEISDFLDVIARPTDLVPFLALLLDHLASQDAPVWRVLDFYNILESSPTLPALKTAAESRGWVYRQDCLQHCPYIPLPGNWDAYLAGIDKKQRHEIRRKMRRIEDLDINARWYIVQDQASLESEIEDFLRLMGQDAEKQAFLTEAMREQMRTTMKISYQAGWLQLAFLEIEGEKAAGYLSFDCNNHIWVYNSGMDERFREYSPGWVLLGYLLQWANEHGRSRFDFMRGNEEYKYRFGGIDRFVVRAQVTR
jgi:CelD/BcsL family acetyltransferase involved in cellulose biosynthesis